MLPLTFRIVLVEPLHSGNVGSVARVMKNFGFSELVLLNPCELDMRARVMAVHAYDIIENARIEFSLKDALVGSSVIIGTTGLAGTTENEHMRMPALVPERLRKNLPGKAGSYRCCSEGKATDFGTMSLSCAASW